MARITYGAIATELRGSVGGSTFQKNKFGFTMKNKPNMARLQSVDQNAQHRLLDYIVKGWQQITDAQRASWSAWALAHPVQSKHNPSAILDGYTYFLRYNLEHALFVSTYLAEPNPGTLALPSINPYLVFFGGALSVNPQPTVDTPAIFFNLFLSPPMAKTRSFSNSFTRGMTVLPLQAGNVDISSFYLGKFGHLPATGNTVFAEFQLWGGSIPYIFGSQKFVLTVL